MQPKISLVELCFEVTMADKLVNAVHVSMVAMLETIFVRKLVGRFVCQSCHPSLIFKFAARLEGAARARPGAYAKRPLVISEDECLFSQ